MSMRCSMLVRKLHSARNVVLAEKSINQAFQPNTGELSFYPYGWLYPISLNTWDKFFNKRMNFIDRLSYKFFNHMANMVAIDVCRKSLNGPSETKKNRALSKENVESMAKARAGLFQLLGYSLYFPGEIASSVPDVLNSLFNYLNTNSAPEKRKRENWQESRLFEPDLRILLSNWKERLRQDSKDVEFKLNAVEPCTLRTARVLRSASDDDESLYFMQFQKMLPTENVNGIEQFFAFGEDQYVMKHGNMYYPCTRDFYNSLYKPSISKVSKLNTFFGQPLNFKYAKIIIDFDVSLSFKITSKADDLEYEAQKVKSVLSVASSWFLPPFQRSNSDKFDLSEVMTSKVKEPYSFLGAEKPLKLPDYFDESTMSVTPNWRISDFQELVSMTTVNNISNNGS